MKNYKDYLKQIKVYLCIRKLQEEVGEVAQEFLAYDDKQNGIKTNSSKSAEGTIEAVIEEVCDATNVCIDLLNSIEMKHPQLSGYIEKRFQEKLDKRESKIIVNKNEKPKSCSNCKFLDTTVRLMSYPPQFYCKSNESGKYSVKCDKIDTFKCDFHEFNYKV